MREANSICKDNDGFIWVSSKTGILRLAEDDYRFYHLPYETANIISVKLIFEHSELLAYTNNGQVFLYDELYDRFDLLINISKELNNFYLGVNSLVLENMDAFFVATSQGLYQYENNQLAVVGGITDLINHAIKYDSSRIIISRGNELSMFDTKSHELEFVFEKEDVPNFEVSTYYLDTILNRLWMGTVSSGLFCYDFTGGEFVKKNISSLPRQPILAIESISDSTLLIGIDGQGLWEINKQNWQVLNIYKENADNPSSLRGNGVYDIFCEQDKRVWVCTYSGGISYFDLASSIVTQITHHINNPNSLANNDVNCIIEDRAGNLWMATNNGISRFNVTENKWDNFYVNEQKQAQVFLTLCESVDGKIWAGTYSSGVYIIDGKSGRQLAHYSKNEKNTPFINDYVFDIYRDSRGDIWIGGINSEVVRYRLNEKTFRKYTVQPINVLTEFEPGTMLFGCTYGLVRSDNETGNFSVLINGCLIQDILVLDGIIWIGTTGDGLIRFDPENGEQEKFTIRNGLPSNFVNSVTYSDGYLWVGTENGLCRFDPVKKSFMIYSSILPLSSSSFNRNAHYKLSNGQLAWGTNNGVVMFNPRTIKQVYSKGKIFIQDISISGRSIREISSFKLSNPINELEKIKLKYNQNTIAFELIPIGVASGAKLSWKMEGLDDEWTQPANLKIINYSNIPNRDYTLKIKLYDNSLSEILAERSFQIEVTPPFWATSWFLIIVIILISSVVYFVLWYYINMLKQKHTEEKVRFFTNTAHDLRTSLTLIKAPIEELTNENNISEAGRNNINIANEQAMRLSSVVTQLMDFQKADVGKAQMSLSMTNIVSFVKVRLQMFKSLAQGKDVVFKFNSNQPEYYSAIDEAMMEKVIDNLFSNAVKYAYPYTTVKVNLNCTGSNWSLEVIDKGIGISKNAQRQLFKEFYRGENAVNSKVVGSGIGLLIVQNFVSLHDGEVGFSSEESVGSTFRITIPYKKIDESRKAGKDPTQPVKNVPLHTVSVDVNDSQEQQPSDKMHVLLVEDNADLLRFMKSSLQADFDVHVADDGDKAWEYLKKNSPELVVSDVMMPNMDGFKLCQLMKSTFETSHIPIVLLTALSGKAEQLHGLGLGADDYLTKPFDMALLRQKIKTIIQNREFVREKSLKLIKGYEEGPILENELNDQFVKKILTVVRENISNASFGKEEFASAMNVSSSLLYKKMKSLTDQSPTDFIKTVRMDYALELLQSRKYNVTEVSEMCGFASVGYFSTVFKKHFNQKPTEV
ncbi:MAG: response regulator [Prolixibacteraceae bacterium]|nr:response regulator [Prolixibacteraceae bacterium]